MKEMIKRLLEAVGELRESGILTWEDEGVILGEVENLYSDLYKPYKELREVKMTLEERLENPYLKMKWEAMTEGRTEGRVEGRAEVARNLLKAGVSRDIIIQATGLSMSDISAFSQA
jgi:predicted transposase/invertase (TIGR01784 family)